MSDDADMPSPTEWTSVDGRPCNIQGQEFRGPAKKLIAYKFGKKASQAVERTLWLLEASVRFTGFSQESVQVQLQSLSEQRFQAAVIHFAEKRGWTVIHHPDSRRATGKGFPDLWMIREAGEYESGTQHQTMIMYRELKSMTGKNEPEQDELQLIIGSAGEDVSVWRPCDWERIKREIT